MILLNRNIDVSSDIERLRKLLHPGTIVTVTAWVFIFSILFFSPTFGLGRIWKNKINDYYKAYPGMWISIIAVTIIAFLISLILDPLLSSDVGTRWWYGLVFGGGLGLAISAVTVLVTAINRYLYSIFYSKNEPESWGLTILRCIYYVVMLTTAGCILTSFR